MPPKKRTTATFKQEMMIKYDGKVEIIGEYLGGDEPIDFIYYCDKHGMIPCTMNAKNISSNKTFQPCNACASESKSKNSGVGRGSDDLFKEFDDYVKSKCGKLLDREWVKSKHKYRIKCDNIDHPIFDASHDDVMHVKKAWCPYCSGRFGNFQEEMEYIVNSKNGILVTDYIEAYTHLKAKCNEHDYTWSVTPANLRKGRWCPVCNLPYSEKVVWDYLVDNNYKFDIQWAFDDLKSDEDVLMRFDFVIFNADMSIKYILEIDENSHRYNMTNPTKAKIIIHDKIKDKYCEDNGILIYRLEIDQYHKDYRDRDLYYKFIGKEIKNFEENMFK